MLKRENMAKTMQREDSGGGRCQEEQAVREEGPKIVLPNAGNRQEILAAVAEGRAPGSHWSWMWAGSTGIHPLCR